jgi:stage V sporulation protein S
MNRFFSKLNLQDIKINPEGNAFPPDADEEQADAAPEQVEATMPEAENVVEVEETYAATAIEDAPVVTHSDYAPVVEAPVVATNGQHDVVHSNGHAHLAPETTVPYVADGDVVAVAGEVLKVSARSRPSSVAGAIAGVVREAGRAEVQAIGAGATNQAIKAVAIARDYLSETGIEAICVPAFIDVTIDNEDRTAIRLVVEPR